MMCVKTEPESDVGTMEKKKVYRREQSNKTDHLHSVNQGERAMQETYRKRGELRGGRVVSDPKSRRKKQKQKTSKIIETR